MAEIRVQSELLEAIQATAGALIAQCQVALGPRPESTATSGGDGCSHPNKQSAASMGAPHAWYCPDCHEQGGR